MDKCGICLKPADQLFETGREGVYACFKCQPLVPEVTIEDNDASSPAETSDAQQSIAEENNESLYCGICDKTFQKSVQLQNHLRNHRAERRFVCTYCNKAFSQSNNLRAHLRIHTNERPFKCSECGKAFTQVTNLNNHVRLHTGERPFVCPEPGCNKAYAQVTNLNQHRKRHLNGRPVEATYDCTVCGEQFQQRNHMYSHRREMHPELKSPQTRSQQRHVCKVCDAVLPTEKLLLRHVNRHVVGDQPHEQGDIFRKFITAAGKKRRKDLIKVEGESDDGEASSATGDSASTEGSLTCVFSSCGARMASAREHTEHLLRAHQLRVLTPRSHHRPPRRGRPPKMLKEDPLEIKETDYDDQVKLLKDRQVQFLPKLKVQSLFQ